MRSAQNFYIDLYTAKDVRAPCLRESRWYFISKFCTLYKRRNCLEFSKKKIEKLSFDRRVPHSYVKFFYFSPNVENAVTGGENSFYSRRALLQNKIRIIDKRRESSMSTILYRFFVYSKLINVVASILFGSPLLWRDGIRFDAWNRLPATN